MKYKIVLVSFIVFLKFTIASWGQLSCPPNIDLELGNLSNWHFYNGTVADGPVFTFTASPPIPGREDLTSGSAVDRYGLFPVVDPIGGGYSLQVGDSQKGSLAEKARYYVHVPAGVNNYSLIYRYAVVFEDPGGSHGSDQKPLFQVNAYDSATNVAVSCAQHSYVAGAMPGFLVSPVKDYNGLYPYYKPWSTGVLNLSGYNGRTVTIDVIAADCSLGGHYGYGYVDLSCGLFEIDSKTCNRTYATLTAPPGFGSYTWCDSLTFTHVYGTSQTITTPMPGSYTTYAVILSAYPGIGCNDTLYTHVYPSNLTIKASNDTFVCPKTGVKLFVSASDVPAASPFKYSWAPSTGLSCTSCDNPIASPVASTTYTVTVTSNAGCVRQEEVVIKTDQVTGAVAQVNDSCNGANNGSATISVLTGLPPYTCLWSTVPPQTGVTARSLLSGTYTVTVTDNFGCVGTANVTITEPPANNITIVTAVDPSTCLGTDGYIVLKGLTPGTAYTFTYTVDGLPASKSVVADVSGNVTLSALKAGVYDKITVNISLLPRPYCAFNIVGPLTLVDPPTPPLPSVGNNGPVCVGDTLKLSAKDAMPGVVFNWTGPSGFLWSGSDTAIVGASFVHAGVYTVTATKNACSSTNSTIVKVKPHPLPVATGDTVCSGTDINLSAFSSNGADAFRWAGPDAYSSFFKDPVIHKCKVSGTGVYTITATLNGCTAITTATVYVVPAPEAPVITPVAYCQYDAPVQQLVAAGSNILWYAADGTLCAIPTPKTDVPGETTWYADQRIAGPGNVDPVVCISPRSEVKVRVYKKYNATLTVNDTTVCAGNELLFTAGDIGDDSNGINWDFSGDNSSIKNINPLYHTFGTAGTYTVSATPLHKVCPNTILNKVVHIFPVPALELGPDTSICPGSTTFNLTDNTNKNNATAKWVWSTNETTSGIVIAKPGTYNVTVLINGCFSSDTVTITDACYMDMPNAFTPDGDGTNDYFFPRQYLMKGLAGFKMDIYNRWGQVVYKTNSLTGTGWDGKFNNVLQPQGVFVYRVEVSFKDGHTEHHTGNLTLLR
ncbi:MAG: gliding motility-associated C-terminal protein [Flavipsychrobacter sp.]|nr:gliding motility-associated C-terminal protein [Flavipsychrobacter sp.]